MTAKAMNETRSAALLTKQYVLWLGVKSEGHFGRMTLFICRMRTLTAARLSSDCKNLLKRCGAAEQRHVQTARSNSNARQGQSDGSARWEHAHLLEAVQQCLDGKPSAPCPVDRPFGTIKARRGAARTLTKPLPGQSPATSPRVIDIVGTRPLMAATTP